jgi:hypothetical protein
VTAVITLTLPKPKDHEALPNADATGFIATTRLFGAY